MTVEISWESISLNTSFALLVGLIIGNDVCIGSRCIIKGGVNIGDGAVVGMGSIVTKGVPPYAIFAGNSARLIRMRFPENIVRQLLSTKWWE